MGNIKEKSIEIIKNTKRLCKKNVTLKKIISDSNRRKVAWILVFILLVSTGCGKMETKKEEIKFNHMQKSLYDLLTCTYPQEAKEDSEISMEEIQKNSRWTLWDVNHDGILEVLIQSASTQHASAGVVLYAYINEEWEQLTGGGDEFFIFGSGQVYATQGFFQGTNTKYVSFDKNGYEIVMQKYNDGTEEEREQDYYEIYGRKVTREEALEFEKQLLNKIMEKNYFSVSEGSIEETPIQLEKKEFRTEWCNFETQNIKKYIYANQQRLRNDYTILCSQKNRK